MTPVNMAPTSPSIPYSPTYYEILNLSRSALSSADPTTATALLKHAYRRALLSHHPDKAKHRPHAPNAINRPTSSTPLPSSSTTTATTFTIDQISSAYATLSRPAQRAAYDRSLTLHRQQQQQQGTAGPCTDSNFQTGIENVDLDDLEYDGGPDGAESGTTRWYRSCRCGNARGYEFAEADLEEAADLGELMVGCADCSLWLRVHFAVVDEDVEDEDEERPEGVVGGGRGGRARSAEVCHTES